MLRIFASLIILLITLPALADDMEEAVYSAGLARVSLAMADGFEGINALDMQGCYAAGVAVVQSNYDDTLLKAQSYCAPTDTDADKRSSRQEAIKTLELFIKNNS